MSTEPCSNCIFLSKVIVIVLRHYILGVIGYIALISKIMKLISGQKLDGIDRALEAIGSVWI